MNTSPTYSREERIEIVRRLMNGGDLLTLCNEYKINPVTLHSWRKNLAAFAVGKVSKASVVKEEEPKVSESTKEEVKKRATLSEMRQAVDLLSSGYSLAEVADAYGVWPGTVSAWKKKLDGLQEEKPKKLEIIRTNERADPEPEPIKYEMTPKPNNRLRELEEENRELRALVADQLLEINRLRRSQYH